MKRLFLMAMAALLAAGGTRAAPLAGCEQLPKPSVTVKRVDDPLAMDLSRSYRDLTSLAGDKSRAGWQVLGLTRANAVARFSLEMRVLSNGRFECASPAITLTLGIRPLTVFVGREFPRNSCAYKEILEHEMRHVKAYQDHMAKVQALFQEALTRRYATGTPWRGPAGTVQERLSSALNGYWTPAIVREFQRVEGPQRLIDTPTEYARIAKACGGEVQRLVK